MCVHRVDVMDLTAAYSGSKCYMCRHFGNIATFYLKNTGLSVKAAWATKAQFILRKKGKGKSVKTNQITIKQGAGSETVHNIQPLLPKNNCCGS